MNIHFTRILLVVFLIPFLFSCKKKKTEPETPNYVATQEYLLKDVSYGNKPEQKMDVYLPANRTSATKVFVMVHGGGWNAGDKSDFQSSFDWLKQLFPHHAIINLNYRLATLQQPGYDMQIADIKSAIAEIRKTNYGVGMDLFMIGGSAGAHLSMMYAYHHEELGKVKGVCNIVGPIDFTDSAYTNNPTMTYGLTYLIGPYTYAAHPQKWKEVSPVYFIKPSSPPTLSFYGEVDVLVPNTQMAILNNKLQEQGVIHESTMYQGEGHSGWSAQTNTDFVTKVYAFIQTHFN